MLPLGLLLVLLLFCVWKHAGTFNKPVEYTITQQSHNYQLSGSFRQEPQIERLIKAFAKQGAILKNSQTQVDGLRNAQGSIAVVEQIVAHFVQHYKEGQIRYEAETLTVSGIVESDTAKEQMQMLLEHAPIQVRDETQVVKPLPIEFILTQKAAGEYHLSGDFGSTTQKDRLITTLEKSGANVHVTGGIDPALVAPNHVIETVQKLIPHFVKDLQEGEIRYEKGVLNVHGLAMQKPLLDRIKQDLSGAEVAVHTDLALNLKAIKAKEEAARKAAEAKRKAEQKRLAEEAARKAKEEAARKAAEAAAKRAEEERIAQEKAAQEAAAKKAEQERLAKLAAQKAEQERKAQEEAARRAEEERQAKIAEALLQAQKEADARKAAQEARKAAAAKMTVAPVMTSEELAKVKANRQAARENIAKLLEVEIIEFDTAKSTLTPKGENTVDKLALILQNYPLIKVEIAGHTDSDGNDKFNLKLSQERVDTVKKELISQGVDPHRLKAVGYGETRPLVPNTTPENKQKNRRVEIIVIGE